MGKLALALLLLMVLLGPISCGSQGNPRTTYPYPFPTETGWSDVPVFTEADEVIHVKKGHSFIIGFEIGDTIFPIIKEIFDEDLLTLVDNKPVSKEEMDGKRSLYEWFLFKADETGETEITIEHRAHISMQLTDEKTFQVVIK